MLTLQIETGPLRPSERATSSQLCPLWKLQFNHPLPNVCSTTLGDLFIQTPRGEPSARKGSKADLPEFSFPKAGLPKEKRTRCIKLKSRQPNPGIKGSNLGELGRADPCDDNIDLRIRYLNRSLLGVKSMNVFYFFLCVFHYFIKVHSSVFQVRQKVHF